MATKRVECTGLAARVMQGFKERRKKVDVYITKEAAGLLNAILRSPSVLPLQEAGLKEYKLSDELGQKAMVQLQRWAKKRLFGKEREVTDRFGNKSTIQDLVEYKGNMKKKHVDRIKDVLKFYSKISELSAWMDAYHALRDGLNGVNLIDAEEYLDEVEGEDEKAEKTPEVLDTHPPVEAAPEEQAVPA